MLIRSFFFDSYDSNDAVFVGRQIQTVILFDRSVDLVTPFCSQMCYEGLLDEYFNIEAGRMKIPKKTDDEKAPKQFDHISISTKDDAIIEGIRGMHYTKVFQKIKGSCISSPFNLIKSLFCLFSGFSQTERSAKRFSRSNASCNCR